MKDEKTNEVSLPDYTKNGKERVKPGTVVAVIVLTLWLVIMMVPIFFVVVTAFKTDPEISIQGFKWLPESLNWDSFINAWKMQDWLLLFKNSLICTLSVVILSVLINTIAGYAFARLHFRGSNVLFVILLMGLMVPAQSIIIPQFIIVRDLNLYDHLGAIVISFLSAPMGVFLCKQFYISFPRELDEAAELDGCGKIMTFFQIYLPMSGTLIATLVILKGVQVWNDFFYPLIMTTSESTKTIQLGLQMFKGSMTTHYNWLMAAALFTSLPMVILYFCAQKYFVAGIATAGMKN